MQHEEELKHESENSINYFSENAVKGIALPERFTFPFYYEPHALTKIAAAELQHYLETQTDLNHNFGIIKDGHGLAIGKMFGVLVVQDKKGKLGYLSAFSGKLADSNEHSKFVPPVFDMLIENSFFLKEQYILNSINDKVKEIETDENYKNLKQRFNQLSAQSVEEIAAFKKELKSNKQNRKKLREEQKQILSEADYTFFEAYLIRSSLHDKHQFNVLCHTWQQRLDTVKSELAQFDENIEALKKERKEKSAALQQQLFEHYEFLNKDGKKKSLRAIFSETVFGKPPAAAGECATPKLLQHAFLHGYKPLAMAEFWWGAPPKSEIRKHKQFYPACTGKCQPILKHMLEGILMDENPLLKNPGESKKLEIVYEDDSLIVVNKPAELLSVPGINIQDSVHTRLKALFTDIEPLIIHRLDMATSGLLVVAKTKDAHKHIQRQFLKRTVTKRYTALLSKVIEGDEGEIRLPLRGDLDNRPRQLVCFEFGKKAVTKWKVIQKNETTTKIHFWPLTGRTHQLRMHAAHEMGLNAPIVGDDLYGTGCNRLHLHAAHLAFVHPKTGENLCFDVKEEF
ncbi:RluA family pseudouridine synthase [Flavobacterium salilacus subsp. salilacus]|uniref:RluA family pseudouridine synthase n=1 Tax=Flavobacterium TaxID=237 RepID=UPI0010755B62|nr:MULTISPECIES: RluA family pseudouridine synthase [Flavobacterium]KAF2519630.1 RluA family pseudouridine synthase [Flavobacterium salilacus subsp. salilacus]MBE1614468.1 RluA family pseudouridine synthase [Flavobacterium sp. SaA2.13]